jgi:class 3 adenylate cyclase
MKDLWRSKRTGPNPRKLRWLPVQVLLVNLGAAGLIRVYTFLNLRPFTPMGESTSLQAVSGHLIAIASVILPTLASLIYLWPIFRYFEESWEGAGRTGPPQLPLSLVARTANAPAVLGLFCLLGWGILLLPASVNVAEGFSDRTFGTWAHVLIRPVLNGVVAGVAAYLGAEHVCRRDVWPVVFAQCDIAAIPGVLRIRLVHRQLLLWFAISFLPLSIIALITLVRLEMVNAATDPLLVRVMEAIVFLAASAALGGAWLAWLMSRSVNRPLRRLEAAMGLLRCGDFRVQVPVSATDEIGALEEGFNQTAQRLRETYAALESQNRELAQALDRVTFLESVKRGLDRFVPDTVRRLLEADPDASTLAKTPKDVTVLFLDVEGYTRLSETLPRAELSDIVERYFSLYLSDIRRGGGDINETAGDGLMILFQAAEHAVSAVRVALAIQATTAAANQQAQGAPALLGVKIGINSGTCEVGSTKLTGLGGERWTYTATGPVTNVAARLCDYAKQGQILIGPETARRVQGRCRLWSRGAAALKNMAHPVEMWEVETEGDQSIPEAGPELAQPAKVTV